MYNGKCIFRIEYEFHIDENEASVRSEEEIRNMFTSGQVTSAIKEELCSWVFDCERGECHVAMDHFEMSKE